MAATKVIKQNDEHGSVLVKPVVLRIPLTDAQKATAARFTKKRVECLDLTEDDLRFVVGVAAQKADW